MAASGLTAAIAGGGVGYVCLCLSCYPQYEGALLVGYVSGCYGGLLFLCFSGVVPLHYEEYDLL